MTRRAHVHRLPTLGPDDTTALRRAIDVGRIEPGAIAAILGKTEGNGCVNDFSRGFAVQSLKLALAPHVDPEGIAFVMSGGTEGGLAPHLLVFEVREVADPPGAPPALALGVARTPGLPPEAIGRRAQVDAVAEAVGRAMAEAGIGDPEAVHYVQVKCPLLTADRVAEARGRGTTTATADTLKSMGLSRGASALGVALALGEVAPAALAEAEVGRRLDRFSTRASCSAGIELAACEVLLLGNAPGWAGPLVAAHDVMEDAIDLEAVRRALARAGLPTAGQLDAGARGRLVAVLAKAEAASTGRVRGARHTMLDDSDVSATRHARALVGGVLAGLTGTTELFVSGGAEHQGPDGGGVVAVIAVRDGRAG